MPCVKLRHIARMTSTVVAVFVAACTAALVAGPGTAFAATGSGSLSYSGAFVNMTLTPQTITGAPGDTYVATASATDKTLLPATTTAFQINTLVPGLKATQAQALPTANGIPGACFNSKNGPFCQWAGTNAQLLGQTFTVNLTLTVPAGTGTVGSYGAFASIESASLLSGTFVVPASAPLINPAVGALAILAIGAAAATLLIAKRRIHA